MILVKNNKGDFMDTREIKKDLDKNKEIIDNLWRGL